MANLDLKTMQWSAPQSAHQRKLEEAADEFEAMLVENMMQSMRNTLEEESEEGWNDSDGLGKETCYDLMYQQLARAISKNARLGVAEMLKTKVAAIEKMRQSSPEKSDRENGGVWPGLSGRSW